MSHNTLVAAAERLEEIGKHGIRMFQISDAFYDDCKKVGHALPLVLNEALDLRDALIMLWNHLPKNDNGKCAICRIGFLSKAGRCENEECVSHQVRKVMEVQG